MCLREHRGTCGRGVVCPRHDRRRRPASDRRARGQGVLSPASRPGRRAPPSSRALSVGQDRHRARGRCRARAAGRRTPRSRAGAPEPPVGRAERRPRRDSLRSASAPVGHRLQRPRGRRDGRALRGERRADLPAGPDRHRHGRPGRCALRRRYGRPGGHHDDPGTREQRSPLQRVGAQRARRGALPAGQARPAKSSASSSSSGSSSRSLRNRRRHRSTVRGRIGVGEGGAGRTAGGWRGVPRGGRRSRKRPGPRIFLPHDYHPRPPRQPRPPLPPPRRADPPGPARRRQHLDQDRRRPARERQRHRPPHHRP